MENCIFCKIAAGEEPTHTIYEDDNAIAFLDRQPINPGHILVIPKVHTPDFYNLDQKVYAHLMGVVQKLGEVVHKEMNPKKVGLMVAGFDVPHTHVHIIPMHDHNDITSQTYIKGNYTFDHRENPSEEELQAVAQKLSQ